MSVNKHHPHVMILPEDRANEQLANGFVGEIDATLQRRVQVLGVAGGWINVLDQFGLVHAGPMRRWPTRLMVLVFDFDNDRERLQQAKDRIAPDLIDRTFVLGTLSHPEELRRYLGNYELIGSTMARECRDGTDVIWSNPLLSHNAIELQRMRAAMHAILFSVGRPA